MLIIEHGYNNDYKRKKRGDASGPHTKCGCVISEILITVGKCDVLVSVPFCGFVGRTFVFGKYKRNKTSLFNILYL